MDRWLLYDLIVSIFNVCRMVKFRCVTGMGRTRGDVKFFLYATNCFPRIKNKLLHRQFERCERRVWLTLYSIFSVQITTIYLQFGKQNFEHLSAFKIFRFYMKNGRTHLRWYNLLSHTIFSGAKFIDGSCAVWVCVLSEHEVLCVLISIYICAKCSQKTNSPKRQ